MVVMKNSCAILKKSFVSESKTYTETTKNRHNATSLTHSLNTVEIQKRKAQGDSVTQEILYRKGKPLAEYLRSAKLDG